MRALCRVEVTARHEAALGMKWGGTKQVTVQHVTKFAAGTCPGQWQDNIRRITMSTGGNLEQQGGKRIEGGTEAKGQGPNIGQ